MRTGRHHPGDWLRTTQEKISRKDWGQHKGKNGDNTRNRLATTRGTGWIEYRGQIVATSARRPDGGTSGTGWGQKRGQVGNKPRNGAERHREQLEGNTEDKLGKTRDKLGTDRNNLRTGS
jgi:hypothetical protein